MTLKRGIPRYNIEVWGEDPVEEKIDAAGEWIKYEDIKHLIYPEEFKDHEMNKCGNDNYNTPLGFLRTRCDYDDDGNCTHCGVGIPF